MCRSLYSAIHPCVGHSGNSEHYDWSCLSQIQNKLLIISCVQGSKNVSRKSWGTLRAMIFYPRFYHLKIFPFFLVFCPPKRIFGVEEHHSKATGFECIPLLVKHPWSRGIPTLKKRKEIIYFNPFEHICFLVSRLMAFIIFIFSFFILLYFWW